MTASPTVDPLEAPAFPPAATAEDLTRRGARQRAQLRKGLDDLADSLDRSRAWRTVPRGDSANDPSLAPGVDLDLWTLHVRYQRTKDPHVLTRLVEIYSPFAASLARRFQRHTETSDDLHQVAMESLVASLQRFDVEHGRPFPAFASPTITGAIKRHYRDRGWSIHTPRRVHDLAAPVRDARERLGPILGRAPTAAEIGLDLGVDQAVVVDVDQATHARAVTSLDRPVLDDGSPVIDGIGAPDKDLLRAADRIALADAVSGLSDREREVLHLYFFEEQAQREIAERYGVSQMQVSRWLASILARLRSHLQD